MSSLATAVACPVCDGKEVVTRFVKAGHRYARCTRCGLARLDPLPSEREAASLYDESYFVGGGNGGYRDYVADEALHRGNARCRLDLLARGGARPPGALLDIGCAYGFFLDEARGGGWDVSGTEISPGPAEFARRELGLNIESGIAGISGAFDAVTMFQVIAHVVNPVAVLADAARLVRPGGVVAIETPDAASRVARLLGRFWHLATPPSIVWMFDRRTLAEMLRRAGFEPVLTTRTAKEVSIGFVGSVLEQKYPRLGRPVGTLTSRPGLAGRSLRVDLGDELTIVARRVA